MKKFTTLLFILSVLFSFSACGDDDETDIDQAFLVGSWRLDDITIDNVSSNNKAHDQALKQVFKNANFRQSGGVIYFSKDGTYTIQNENTISVEGTYIIQNNKVIVSYAGEDGEFYRRNDQLIMTEVGTQDELEELVGAWFLPDDYQIYSVKMSTYFVR